MTNLTDEGLNVRARDISKVFYESATTYPELMSKSWAINLMSAITSALQQVRDAAKKEEREKAAVLVESSVITRIYGSGQTVVHECSKDPIQLAAAIRQMDGGK